jgi:NADH dehydrogenase [ubiquinone] 1 alpha subcomplex assembly factor 7
MTRAATGAARSLADSFRRLIAATGPISLAQFMGEANARYYAGRDPLGSDGDFITAPEVSQMFGELIGLWLADLWRRAGSPGAVRYVELGPGRGTLAADALRAMLRHGLAPQVHLVEGSPALRALQREAVPEAEFHDDLAQVPADAPLLLVANEFLDALPVRQLVKTGAGWREMMVSTDQAGRFVPVAGDRPMDAAVPETRRDADVGTVLETCPGAAAVVAEAARRLARQGGAALFIDYGHAAPRAGSTLQAVRVHRKVDPFADPGEADLTAHVDFATLAEVARAHGARWLGTVPQGAWLGALGIDARTEALTAAAPGHREALMRARDRLVGDEQMGQLFKVMGLVAPGWPEGAGF